MTAQSGAGARRAKCKSRNVEGGQTTPLCRSVVDGLDFDRTFAQQSLRDIERLEQVCAAWLGYPLERPIAFICGRCLSRLSASGAM